MPEGDTLHRAARRLQALVGDVVEVETPHPRAAAERVADRLHGRRLLAARAHGKNLLLEFDGGLVLRSHLRMTGRWHVEPLGSPVGGRPWLILRGATSQAVLWNGPVLELHTRAVRRLGPDVLAAAPDVDGMVARLRAAGAGRAVGDALLDQRLVAGIGNLWKAEALWRAGVSPWRSVAEVSEDELRSVLDWASRLMRDSLDHGRQRRAIYGRAGRPCPRCATPIRSRGQGEGNRTAYWCPTCQPGADPRAHPVPQHAGKGVGGV